MVIYAKRALETLPEAERHEVAREAWAISKRLVLLNEAAIHLLARRLYQTGRMNFMQILDLLRGQPKRGGLARHARKALRSDQRVCL
jgi:hypothetical protein